MGTWFWLNIPLMLLFLGCWSGIPLWHTLHRWGDEINAKHAELAARAVAVPVIAQQAQVTTAMDDRGSLAYTGVSPLQGH